jgi:hypothetical protein
LKEEARVKTKIALIKPENLKVELEKAQATEKNAFGAYEATKHTNNTQPSKISELRDEYATAHIYAFELSLITTEDLLYEKECALHIVPYNRSLFKKAVSQNNDMEQAVETFRHWGKSLVLAKGFGIEIDTNDYAQNASEFLDKIYHEIQDPESCITVTDWRNLLAHIVKIFSKLEISDSRFALSLQFGLKDTHF